MGDVHLSEPPDAPHDACPMCLMTAKQHQWGIYQHLIKGADQRPDDTWVPWPADAPLIREGRWRGVPGDAPQLGIVDGLCWDHLAGLGPSRPAGGLLDGGKLPPGLMKGRG